MGLGAPGFVGRVRVSRAAVAAAAAALLLGACSSGQSGGGGDGGILGGGGGGTPTTIAQALALMPATSWDTVYAEFGDVEELCVEVSDAAQAAAVSAAWTTEIETGMSNRIKAPWSTLLVDPQATVLPAVNGVSTVRLTAKPASGAQLGAVLQTYFSAAGDLDGLLGKS